MFLSRMRNFAILIILLSVVSCNQPSETKDADLVASDVILDSPNVTVPALSTDLSSNVYMTWVEEQDDSARLLYRHYTQVSGWSETAEIAMGKDWFINWADYPGMVSVQGDLIYAYYLKKSGPDTYSYDIALTRSADGGKTWSPAVMLNEDGTQTEHGFVSMVPSGTDMYVAWLDGRNTTSESGAMTLRAALLGPDGSRKGEWLLDGRVCDCCQTAAAMTDNGPVVIYRDRSENEFRDIAIVRFENYKWSEPMLIYRDAWQISACPVNGPRIDARHNDMAISWFTGADDEPEVKVVFSSDGGHSFTRPVRISGKDAIGRTDIILTEPGKAVVSWMEQGLFRAVYVDQEGNILNEWDIGRSDLSRNSGFPQITKAGDRILAVWRDSESEEIRSALLELN